MVGGSCMIFKDYYRILELETNRVNVDEIRQAYRELAKKYHPDVNTADQFSEDRFKDINEAYRVLSNPSSKRKYDRMWHNYVGKKKRKEFEESRRNSDSPFSDFFDMFFGNIREEKKEAPKKKEPMIKGDNVETEMNVSIEEAFYGVQKKLSLRTVEGNLKTFLVEVPAGIRNHEKLRLIAQGKEGKNGGKNGDLFIKINVQNDEKFALDGFNINTNLYLTPWEAALGTRVKIASIDDEVSVYVPEGIQSGEKIRIPQKGYKDGKGGRGDLVADVKIAVPKQLTEAEKKLFEQMEQISKFDPRK